MPLTDAELRERLNRRRSPAGALLGAEVLELDSAAGRMRVGYEARAEWCNPMGAVQGGFVSAMLDEAAGLCAIAHAQRRVGMPTLEFKVSFLGALRPGRCEVEAHVLRLGGRSAFVEADLFDAGGALRARMSSTAMPLEVADPKLVEWPAAG